MSNYKMVPVEPWHIEYVAENARQDDINELAASSGKNPLEAIFNGVRTGTVSWTMIIDDVPVAIGGVCALNVLYSHGTPWVIGTEDVAKNRLTFFKLTRQYLQTILSYYSHLTNYVDDRNELAKRYLRHMGFILSEPEPYGVKGLPFRKFEMEVSNV